MNLTNTTRFQAAVTAGLEPDGRELLVVAVKSTFNIPPAGLDPELADVQLPLAEADFHSGEPGLSAPLIECDFAPTKPRCDVILNGSAWAPGGVPADMVPVLLKVGTMSKSFQVVGNRAWVQDVFSWKATRPVPFTRMPVSYANAFGGRDLSDPEEKKHRWYRANHAGAGFHSNLYPPLVEGKPLPNTEEIGKPVARPDGDYRPMAFGPIGRSWEPRYKLAGTCDQRWLDEVCPFLPSDFKNDYYQSAPADQQIPHPAGGEEVVLVNLTPDGRRSFRLPVLDLPVVVLPKDGAPREYSPRIDTILLEPDQNRFSLVSRVTHPLRKNMLEIGGVVVGRKSRGWHRARALGKTHFRSLREAMQGRGGP